MINYANEKSPFYNANEQVCKKIEESCNTRKGSVVGFCNSYGYEVSLNFEESGISYQFEFIKNQSTQNGVWIPTDALDYFGFELFSNLPNRTLQIKYGKSNFQKLFTSSKFKNIIPNGQSLRIRSKLDDGKLIQLAKYISM